MISNWITLWSENMICMIMAPHSSTLAWKIPWTEEPDGLQSTGSLGVGHDWATSLSLFTFLHWRRKWQLTPVFLPGESQGWGAWWAAVCGVTQSRTRLKRLSSSSNSPLKYVEMLVMAQYVVSVLNVLLQLLECSVCVCFNKLFRSVIQTFCRLNFLLFCRLALSVTELCVKITYFDCEVVYFSLNYVVALSIF